LAARCGRWVGVAIAAVVLVLVLSGNLQDRKLTAFRIPSAGLAPTLKIGRSSRDENARHPRIGDIIVFHPPRGADSLTPVCRNADQGSGH
jgi:signal peptidase I